MSYIKQTGLLSGPFMAVPNTQVGILDRHGEASEWDHFRPMLKVQII